jgi:HSP20 family protein
MVNIVKRTGNENQLEMWDPFRAMRDLMRWDPFREMAPMMAAEREWMPAFEVREDKDAFHFKADLPGIKREDVDVSLTGNRLVIAGKREAEKEAKEDTFYAYERSYGSFKRIFTLPEGIDADHVTSELENGVLTLVVPKKAEALAKKIPVAAPGRKS